MKNLLLVLSIVFLGACSNNTTGTARHQCCADAMANGKQCECCEPSTDAKSMSAGAAAVGATKECSAAASSCSEKSAMSCCDEAKAASKECSDCVAKP